MQAELLVEHPREDALEILAGRDGAATRFREAQTIAHKLALRPTASPAPCEQSPLETNDNSDSEAAEYDEDGVVSESEVAEPDVFKGQSGLEWSLLVLSRTTVRACFIPWW